MATFIPLPAWPRKPKITLVIRARAARPPGGNTGDPLRVVTAGPAMTRFALSIAPSLLSHARAAHPLLALASLAALLLPCAGCVVEDTGNDTRVELQEMDNLGYRCGGPLTSWTVTARETREQATAGCEQPVLFVDLAPNRTYTFDVEGFAGKDLCWQGSCQVFAEGGHTTVADCRSAIRPLCTFR